MSSSEVRNGEVGLFGELPSEPSEARTTGILPSQTIEELIARGKSRATVRSRKNKFNRQASIYD